MDEFSAYFGEVDDPRAGDARHNLLELLFVALAAVLCGAEDCTDMAAFARFTVRTHPDKGSIKGKIKRAGWNDAFLLSMLGHMR